MRQKQLTHGLTLIEVLVAVLILSIGLLGLAGLQITGLRSVHNASFYTMATLYVDEMIERMRANPIAVDDNLFSAINTIDCSAFPAKYCSTHNAGSTLSQTNAEYCTPDELAIYDINTWFCGERTGGNASTDRTTSPNQILAQAAVTIACEDTDPVDSTGTVVPDADTCTSRSPHTITLSWQENNPEALDIDGDGDPDDTLQKIVRITFIP